MLRVTGWGLRDENSKFKYSRFKIVGRFGYGLGVTGCGRRIQNSKIQDSRLVKWISVIGMGGESSQPIMALKVLKWVNVKI